MMHQRSSTALLLSSPILSSPTNMPSPLSLSCPPPLCCTVCNVSVGSYQPPSCHPCHIHDITPILWRQHTACRRLEMDAADGKSWPGLVGRLVLLVERLHIERWHNRFERRVRTLSTEHYGMGGLTPASSSVGSHTSHRTHLLVTEIYTKIH